MDEVSARSGSDRGRFPPSSLMLSAELRSIKILLDRTGGAERSCRADIL